MINIRTMQQLQTQESTSECTRLVSTQSVQPCLSEYEINSTVRGERRGHTKGVGHQLKRLDKQVGPSSSAPASSSSSIRASTSSQPIVNSKFMQQKVQGMIQLYHQYLQSYMSTVMPGF